MAEIGKDIAKAKRLLQQGELVAIPTETVYGLAGNALNMDAVTKIFEVKKRPSFDPLIIHVPDLQAVMHYTENFPLKALALANTFWPGPLTLLLRKKDIIPDLVTSGLDTVGIRCPDHELTRSLLQQVEFPLAAPSANPFGYVSPTRPEHVNEQLGDKISYILDGGICSVGIESTIVGFDNNLPTLYRLGGISVDEIQNVVGRVEIILNTSSNPLAPGQLKSHYAPSKKMLIGNIDELLKITDPNRTAILSFCNNFNALHQIILSPSGNLRQAAKNLFAALRELDKLEIDTIITEYLPEEGLGLAINDRLKRAASS